MTMDAARQAAQKALATGLASHSPPIRLRLNQNRRLLVSLRSDRGDPVLSLHEHLLDHPAAMIDLLAWVRRGGRGSHPVLRAAMRVVFESLRHDEGVNAPPLPPLPVLGGPLDLEAMFNRVHATWFTHIPKPPILWSRGRNATKRQQHIRFGCYRRSPSPPSISVHPRLDQPWIAVCFVEHVLFHELCHHAQACRPIRGEAMHGKRFRDWERRYPNHVLALAWERAHLRHLLDGTVPEAAIRR